MIPQPGLARRLPWPVLRNSYALEKTSPPHSGRTWKRKGGRREGDVPAPLKVKLVGGRSTFVLPRVIVGGKALGLLTRSKTQRGATIMAQQYCTTFRASCRDRTDDLPLTRRPLWPSELRRRSRVGGNRSVVPSCAHKELAYQC